MVSQEGPVCPWSMVRLPLTQPVHFRWFHCLPRASGRRARHLPVTSRKYTFTQNLLLTPSNARLSTIVLTGTRA